jgi:hypothetical protein
LILFLTNCVISDLPAAADASEAVFTVLAVGTADGCCHLWGLGCLALGSVDVAAMTPTQNGVPMHLAFAADLASLVVLLEPRSAGMQDAASPEPGAVVVVGTPSLAPAQRAGLYRAGAAVARATDLAAYVSAAAETLHAAWDTLRVELVAKFAGKLADGTTPINHSAELLAMLARGYPSCGRFLWWWWW